MFERVIKGICKYLFKSKIEHQCRHPENKKGICSIENCPILKDR